MTFSVFIPLAFGIGSPWMFAWAAAAALPVLIHLLSNRKHREIQWGAMEYLLAAVAKQSRRLHVEHWILLAMRTALVALLVAALADMYSSEIDALARSDQPVHRLFVVDGSFSMSRAAGDESRFDLAKKRVIDAVANRSRQGDAFTLILMADTPRGVVRTPALDRDYFIREVERLEMPHGGANLPAALDMATAIVEGAAEELPRVDRHEVYFLTDLGRTTWAPEGRSADWQNDVAKRARTLVRRARIAVEDLGVAGGANLAITRLQLQQPLATTDRPTTLSAEVKSFSPYPSLDARLEWLIDGRVVGRSLVRIDKPRGEVSLSLPYRFDAPGDHAIEARLTGGDDVLEIDNHRYLSLPVSEKLRVLVVGGKPLADRYLPAALAPNDQRNGVIDVDVASQGALFGDVKLEDYDCAFLVNVGMIAESQARRFDAYLQQGGALVFFLGDQTSVDALNRTLGSSRRGGAILPARLIGPSPLGQYAIDPVDYRHPLVRPFAGAYQTGLLTTPLYRYMRMAAVDDPRATVAMRVAGGDSDPSQQGDPLAIDWPVGRGRVIVFGVDASLSSVDEETGRPWTYWPIWGSFVPVVQETLFWSLSNRTTERNATVGHSLSGRIDSIEPDESVAVARLDSPEKPEAIRPTREGDSMRWSFDGTDKSGFYTASAGQGADRRGETFAVNIDVAESDLTRADLQQLPAELRAGAIDGDESSPGVAPLERRSGWSEPILLGVLALLVAEIAVAWRFGRRRT